MTRRREARVTTIGIYPVDLRKLPEAGRPGTVIFESCTADGRVADACAELRLHSFVADPMHEASSRREVERHTTEGEMMPSDGHCKLSHAGGTPIGLRRRRQVASRQPPDVASGTSIADRDTGRTADAGSPTTTPGVADATGIGVRTAELALIILGAERGRAGVPVDGPGTGSEGHEMPDLPGVGPDVGLVLATVHRRPPAGWQALPGWRQRLTRRCALRRPLSTAIPTVKMLP
ncbi:MAG: hypothetical protein WKF75_13705, partial [Singulisphaera sp.]